MATFKAGEENNYGGTGGSGFFSISNDKETKQVRFMYNGIEDIEGMSVHKVNVGGKDRYVNCLRAYNDPVDACPLCRKYAVQARLFIPVYNIDEDQVQIWDRGKTMFSKMSSLCSRYAAKGKHLVNNVFEIERNGKPKDTKTVYEIYSIDSDDVELEDLPEPRKILGGLVLDKSVEDMEYYLDNGEFPSSEEDDEVPVRRRESSSRNSGRRTPTGRHAVGVADAENF